MGQIEPSTWTSNEPYARNSRARIFAFFPIESPLAYGGQHGKRYFFDIAKGFEIAECGTSAPNQKTSFDFPNIGSCWMCDDCLRVWRNQMRILLLIVWLCANWRGQMTTSVLNNCELRGSLDLGVLVWQRRPTPRIVGKIMLKYGCEFEMSILSKMARVRMVTSMAQTIIYVYAVIIIASTQWIILKSMQIEWNNCNYKNIDRKIVVFILNL